MPEPSEDDLKAADALLVECDGCLTGGQRVELACFRSEGRREARIAAGVIQDKNLREQWEAAEAQVRELEHDVAEWSTIANQRTAELRELEDWKDAHTMLLAGQGLRLREYRAALEEVIHRVFEEGVRTSALSGPDLLRWKALLARTAEGVD
jgi:chromosome segregation ATPase